MIFDSTNCDVGNKAMAQVLLLYYHLLDEGGISNDQTVYLDPAHFNGFDFLGSKVVEGAYESLDLDERLINEGAVIYLLCDLNDTLAEYDEDFKSHPSYKKIVASLTPYKCAPIPELEELLEQMAVSEEEFDYSTYNQILQGIYTKYVRGFFKGKLA